MLRCDGHTRVLPSQCLTCPDFKVPISTVVQVKSRGVTNYRVCDAFRDNNSIKTRCKGAYA